MIEKLRKKISLIVLFAISIPLLFIIIFYTVSYRENIIRTNAQFVDRMFVDPNGKFDNNEDKQINIHEMEGIYSVSINNNGIFKTDGNVTEELKDYALKISDNKKESGIIGNYIYKKRIINENNKDLVVIFIESKSEISKINMVIISSIIILGIGFVLIYILSKKIACLIVKPVEETFNKQRDFISDASHELKTPLAVIQANADVLEGEIGKNKWLSYIQNESDNMGKLISELLLLTKIENVDKLRKP